MKGLGLESVVMPEWWTPADTAVSTGKRDSPEEASSDASTAAELDWDNLARYTTLSSDGIRDTTGLLIYQEMHIERMMNKAGTQPGQNRLESFNRYRVEMHG